MREIELCPGCYKLTVKQPKDWFCVPCVSIAHHSVLGLCLLLVSFLFRTHLILLSWQRSEVILCGQLRLVVHAKVTVHITGLISRLCYFSLCAVDQ